MRPARDTISRGVMNSASLRSNGPTRCLVFPMAQASVTHRSVGFLNRDGWRSFTMSQLLQVQGTRLKKGTGQSCYHDA